MNKIFKYLCGGLMMLGGALLPTKAVADKVTITTTRMDIYVWCDIRHGQPNGTIHVDYGDGYTDDFEAKYGDGTRIRRLYSGKTATAIITTDYPLIGLECEAVRNQNWVNDIISLDLSDCPSLVFLKCSGYLDNDYMNHLSSLDLSGLTSLDRLDCSNNELTTLQFDGELSALNVANNHLALSVLNTLSKKWKGSVYGDPLILSPQRIVQVLTVGENWDLTSEMTIDGTVTAYTLTDEAGAPVSEAVFVEKDGVFRFRRSGKYILTLTNPQITDYFYDEDYQDFVAGEPAKVIYDVTVSGTDIAVYTVEATPNAAVGGTVSGDGLFESGEEVTLTAMPFENYVFVHWVDADGEVVSTENPYTFAVTSDVALTAVFKIYHNVSVTASAGGTVSQSGSGVYEAGDEVTITAMPFEDYVFVHWVDADGEVVSTENPYTFAVTSDVALTAVFRQIIHHTLAVTASNGGTVSQSGNGVYEAGDAVTITATPATGFRFVNWERVTEQTVYATEAVYTFKITEDLMLKANFEKEADPITPVDPEDPDDPDDPNNPDDPDDPDDPENPDDPDDPDTPDDPDDPDTPDRPGDTTAIEDLTVGTAMVYVKAHTIYVADNTSEVRVYTNGGMCVYSGRATEIPVRQSGVYVVWLGDRRFKILVP